MATTQLSDNSNHTSQVPHKNPPMSHIHTHPARFAGTLAALALTTTLACAAQSDPASPPAATKAAAPRPPAPLTPGGKYPVGDMARPRPPVVDPGTASTPAQAGQPPSDATVLFDGKDLSRWETRAGGQSVAPKWKVENGYMEVTPRGGSINTKQKFGDGQYHLEFATPAEVKGSSQGRGNSGFFLPGYGELQILDSYQNDTYPDGQAAALYGKYPPQVNASRKPGEWQTYDIVLEQTKTGPDGQVIKPGHITVFHNGVLVHHAVEFTNRMSESTLSLQDHGNPMRFRNIWVRKLPGYDSGPAPTPKPAR